MENDITYLYEEVFDYKDLLRVLPPEHKWGGEDVQTALNTMTGVTIDDLKQVETLFDPHIDVFALIESTSTDKRKDQMKKLVQQWLGYQTDLLIGQSTF